ncbi:hypothetical protein Prudu_014233 [Prunus dulcis]|uniref:Histone deacetylase complex subunit SAP30 Sin3 binding domain-containing protein n=1 Tax=Prunus dulcis TaxID=3755 RepID=A0A4Y1RGJ5_PRUDU|nr:hypothetical protein Prudu_014233 [Prunus dulcis]
MDWRIQKMLEPELCSSRMLSPFREESGDEELSVLPRHTKVIVTGNNRTKSVLVGLQGVVKKAVGLGSVGTSLPNLGRGPKFDPLSLVDKRKKRSMVLKNGVEVKLQRNALSVLEHPTGNEEDSDHDYSSSSSDHARCLEFHKSSKPRVRYPRPYVPSTLTKSINRGSYREVQSIHRPQPLTSNSNPTREQLINVAQRHFISQQMPLDEVSVVTEFVDATRSRKYAEWAGKRAEREM